MKKRKQRVFSTFLITTLALGALVPITSVDASTGAKTDTYVAPRTGLNVTAPDAPTPYPKEEHKLLPGEPAPGTWGYDVKTGIFTHPMATPDNEGPQPFNVRRVGP
ncbi:hypothetical protein [Brevibacillus sp. NRS-1366]|uniref:hypothetical protein n=1 Tax=Brevibacillus sp. NRS-1366 TaxID=3233899 RepID=UPI003D201CD2